MFFSGTADVAQLVEQLICNHQVGGSNPFVGSRRARVSEMSVRQGHYRRHKSVERYPSGQRGRAVNPLAFAYGGSNPPLSTSYRGRGSMRKMFIAVLGRLRKSGMRE